MTPKHLIAGLLLFGAVGGAIALRPMPNQAILPNPKLTPGVTNPQITQANIGDNICNPKWSTGSIRPSVSYTNKLKATQIKEYGYQDTKMADFEEDHLVSLELGGSPTDPKNLWPESYLTDPNARDKDKVENYLHKQVCSGTISLKEAQREISTNWLSVYQKVNSYTELGSTSDE